MKSITTLLFLFCYTCGDCQVNPADSSFTCMANWKKGEEKIFTIQRDKQTIRSGSTEPPFTFNYEAAVTILDSTGEGYKIQWVFHLPDLVKKLNPGLAEAMPVYEGLKMIFLTTKEGLFTELINWQEVKNAFIKMMEVSLPPNPSEETKAAIEKSIELFNSKEMVESTMIPEIQIYYSPYGSAFTQKGISTAGTLATPFSEDPLPCIISEKITEIKPGQDLIGFSQHQKMDKGNTGKFPGDLFKKMGIQEDSVLLNVKEIIASLELTDHREYLITPSTGWINSAIFYKIVKSSERINKESIKIVLK
jgi:hypothetical protein